MMSRSGWRLFWGLLFIVLGSVWLWNNLDLGPHIPLGDLWPLLLVGLGVYMILRQTGYLGQPFSTAVNVDRVLGDLRLGGPDFPVRDRDIFTIIGDIDIDLRQAQIPEGETKIHVRSLIGDVDIIVPLDVGVFVGSSVIVGEMKVLDHRRDGFLQDLTVTSADYQTATHKIRIEVDMAIGDISIMRAGA